MLPECEQAYTWGNPVLENPVTADKVLHHIASYKIWDLKSPDLQQITEISILYIYSMLTCEASSKIY